MIFVTYCVAGVFALSREKEIVEHSLFPKEPGKIAEKMDMLERGETTEELEEVLEKIKDKDIVTDIKFIKEGFNVEYREKISASDYLRENLREISVKTGFVSKPAEITRLISEIQLLKTKRKIKSGEKKDRIAMHAASSVEDLVDITNRLSERLHEWYGLYYPELEGMVKDNRAYAELLSRNPIREETKGFSETIGMDLDEKDLEIIRVFSENTTKTFELKEEVEKYLKKVMPEVAPNITSVAGPLLAAKLMVLAGGLNNLAKLPSSTIQLLGAEKALFRFMKNKKKSAPPKYGIIFLHPEVTNAPDGLKGKVARAVASELSMAAKTDFYTQEDKSRKYKKKLDKRIREIFKK